jgi:hypothetical protein
MIEKLGFATNGRENDIPLSIKPPRSARIDPFSFRVTGASSLRFGVGFFLLEEDARNASIFV